MTYTEELLPLIYGVSTVGAAGIMAYLAREYTCTYYEPNLTDEMCYAASASAAYATTFLIGFTWSMAVVLD